MLHPAFYAVLGHAAGTVLLSWCYFRWYRVTRPPLGVFNLRDVAIMVVSIVLVPYLYLALPTWLVVGLVVVGVLSVLYLVWEPVLRARWGIWLATLGLAVADVGAMHAYGAVSTPFFVINNVVLVLSTVGVANLWAQSGMKARDAAVLGAALAFYDFVATTQLSLMTDLVARLAELPFPPLVAWQLDGHGQWLGIGMGDLMLASVFPLVMRKAFGRAAGLTALAVSLGALAAVLAPFGWSVEAFPVMIVLGPLMVAQYAGWAHRQGTERTTWQYLQAEPIVARSGPRG
jgi:hypothetical protein